jgi:hypothetical protein
MRASATRRMPHIAKGDCGREKVGVASYYLGGIVSPALP